MSDNQVTLAYGWTERVDELDSGAEVSAAKIRAEQAATNSPASVG